MTDEELIGYADIHCETDVALFHVSHVERLLDLAGIVVPNLKQKNWYNIYRAQMTEILDAIKARKAAAQQEASACE